MSHVYHEGLRGYNPSQLLHDGCPECEARGEQPMDAIANLDAARFVRAWSRAAAWQQGRLPDEEWLSAAEVPSLRVLWAVQVSFERHLGVPIGFLPVGTDRVAPAALISERLQTDAG
jgi:hypothetical protein